MYSTKNLYLILEYAEGGELFEKLLSDGSFSENEARKYFRQLIDAIGYMHANKAYHRDLKLENILLDK